MKGKVICFILGYSRPVGKKMEQKNITVSDHIESNSLWGPTTVEND